MRKTWIQLTLFYLCMTAIAGVLMRSMALVPIPRMNYGHILHAHSHLAILGWGYMALFLLILVNFFDSKERSRRQVTTLYWLTQLTIVGMFVAFSLRGYGLFSISFSTLHIFLSYWFAIFVWRHLRRQTNPCKQTPISHLFVKGSLVCLVLSSLGPWMLAVLSANHLTENALFDAAIYFYLHFQYSGWFTLGLIAVLLRILEKRNIFYPEKLAKLQFGLYVLSVLPSFLLSVLWIKLDVLWELVAAVGALLQWSAIVVLIAFVYQIRSSIQALFQGWANIFFVLSLVALFMKVTMEIGSVVPSLSVLIYDSRNIVIGYLHLTLLGFVSFLCISLFIRQGWLDNSRKGMWIGYVLFLIGFVINELVLFLQGLFEWIQVDGLVYQREWLLVASIGMTIGIIMFSIKRTDASNGPNVEKDLPFLSRLVQVIRNYFRFYDRRM